MAIPKVLTLVTNHQVQFYQYFCVSEFLVAVISLKCITLDLCMREAVWCGYGHILNFLFQRFFLFSFLGGGFEILIQFKSGMSVGSAQRKSGR